jgi:hypothetical protein
MKSFTYFITDEKSKAVKIGVSRNLETRLQELQVGNPNPLKIRLALPIEPDFGKEGQGLWTEYAMQQKFAHLHLLGEWYRLTPEVRQFIVEQNARLESGGA